MSLAIQPTAMPPPALRVSPYSLFGDDHWQMARDVVGHEDTTFGIDWAFGLTDGSRFSDPCWHELSQATKLFLWSLHSDPMPGRAAVVLRTLVVHGHRLRSMLRWMIADGIKRWADLDRDAIERLFAHLNARRGRPLAASTARGYQGTLHIFYLQRARLPDAPLVDPPPYDRLGEWRPGERLPHTPDAIAVPLLASALHLIGEPADAILALRDDMQERYDRAIREGVTHKGAMLRIRVALRKLPAISLRAGTEATGAMALKIFRESLSRLYDACFVVIAYLIGARVSEILTLETGCIEWLETEDGERQAYLVGAIRKDAPGPEGLVHRWVAPDPVVRAVAVLERLSAPWREIDGRPLLWLTQSTPSCPLPSPGLTIMPLTIDTVNERLNKRYVPAIGLPHYQGKPWRLTTHQGRKTFARFIGRRDRTGLAALAKHLGHVTRAMTDRGYVGTDFELAELVDAQAASETRAALEELLVAPRLGGKAGRAIAARSPFRGRTHKASDLDAYITNLLAETDMRLGVCDWGYCLYRRETSACLGSDKEPNPTLRTQSVCATCANFVVSERHRPVWEDRLGRNLALLDRFDLDPESRALAQERIRESHAVLEGLESNDDGITG